MTNRDIDIERLLPLPPAVLHILIALGEGEKHGYAMMREVADRTEGKVRMSPGTLYGSIRKMLDDGLIEEAFRRGSADDERRRYRAGAGRTHAHDLSRHPPCRPRTAPRTDVHTRRAGDARARHRRQYGHFQRGAGGRVAAAAQPGFGSPRPHLGEERLAADPAVLRVRAELHVMARTRPFIRRTRRLADDQHHDHDGRRPATAH